MAKVKLTVENDLKTFKAAAGMADIEILDLVELGPNMYKSEVNYKHPSQLRLLGVYEEKIKNQNVKLLWLNKQ